MTLSLQDAKNRIRRTILDPIDLLIARGHGQAAVILLFAGIDAMAYLGRPEGQSDTTSRDFQEWVARYFHLRGQTEVSPEEWSEARNAIIHTFGVYSRRIRRDGLRILGWGYGFTPHILYDSARHPEMVLVDVGGMRDAFTAGVYQFLEEAFSETTRRELITRRFEEMLEYYPSS